MFTCTRKLLPVFLCLLSLLIADDSRATIPDVSLIFDQNLTVDGGYYTRLILPQSGMDAGNTYTLTVRPISGEIALYGDPYIYGIVYHTGSTTRRVRRSSRYAGDTIEQTSMDKSLQDQGEDNAEFRVYCESSESSCKVRATVHMRLPGGNEAGVFYTEGREPRVSNYKVYTYQDFYHPTAHTGDYGHQVHYEAGQYIYLFNEDGVDGGDFNSLTFWVRSSGSVNEGDLSVSLTDANHSQLMPWQSLANYTAIKQAHTWYLVTIPLIDLGVANRTFHGLAIKSNATGFVYFDEIRTSNSAGSGSFKLQLPLNGYTPSSVPISAVMDNSLGAIGLITTYDGDEARYEWGCRYYDLSGNSTSCNSLASYSPPSDVLGYKGQYGQSFLTGLNYNDQETSGNEYLWYDEHTGYDFALGQGTPVYSTAGGTISRKDNSWNEVVIDHGNGYTSHFLHMLYDTYLIPDGAIVVEGQRIGTIGGTGGVQPHLHLTVKKDGVRVDPYGAALWK